MATQDSSKKSPLVSIHGLIGSLSDPTIQVPLAPRMVFAPELLGYGEFSDTNPSDITISNQVEHVHRAILQQFGAKPVHVLGHSVGGAIAALLIDRYPEQVVSFINAEGNFTLQDAFWSARIAQLPSIEVAAMLNEFQTDPDTWLRNNGISPTPDILERATARLANQPATTIQAMSRSVVALTGEEAYLKMLKHIFQTKPVHLLAGERTRNDWGIPNWALKLAASDHTMPKVGHMMMLEDPLAFGKLLQQILRESL